MKKWFVPAVCFSACVSAPMYRGPVTDHFDGEHFFTPGAAAPSRGVGKLLKWYTSRDAGPWKSYREEAFGPPPPTRVGRGALRVTFVNHATTLLQLDGVNVLTDPIYAARASPFSFAGPHRVRPPGIRFEDLPPIDAVLISHNHYDHLNVETLRRLQDAFPKVQVFCGLGNKAFLESAGLHRVAELDWWQSTNVGAVQLTSVPTQHFSNRGLTDGEGTLWTGFVLEGSAGRVYFAGDTGYGPHFKKVGDALGPFRLALLPIGAYLPEWFMSPVHMKPADAVTAMGELQARVMVPMHYGTFPLADDGEEAALDALRQALSPVGQENEASKSERIWVLGFGEGREVPQ